MIPRLKVPYSPMGIPVSYGQLHVHHPDGSTQAFELAKNVVRIGRSLENDLVLAGREVSRNHARLALDEDGPATLTDLNSVNGVSVNGKRVRGTTHIYTGDVVWIGGYQLIYSAPEERGAERTGVMFRVAAAPLGLDEPQGTHSGRASTPASLHSIELLQEVSIKLARTATVADVAETAVTLLFKIEAVQRAVLMPWEEETQDLKAGKLRVREGISVSDAAMDPRRLVLSRSILRRVRWEDRPLHIQDDIPEDATSSLMGTAVPPERIRAAFCSPLTFHGRQMGVLYADNLADPNAFSEADFRLFTTISAQTCLALATATSRGELLKREVEQAAMRLYMPQHVADLIAATDGSVHLGGVQQTVTVLFADIRGFTSMAEHMDAVHVVQLLNEFLTAMTQVILEARGTLDKYIGDCVMALFGAPVPSQEDADRAVAAAIQMQHAVERMNAARAKRGLKGIHIGVGLHTGWAVVGNIGSEQRMQYTAVGDAVNVAARLMEYAKADQILVSEPCVETLQHRDALQPLGHVQLKGRDQSVRVFSVSWT